MTDLRAYDDDFAPQNIKISCKNGWITFHIIDLCYMFKVDPQTLSESIWKEKMSENKG